VLIITENMNKVEKKRFKSIK